MPPLAGQLPVRKLDVGVRELISQVLPVRDSATVHDWVTPLAVVIDTNPVALPGVEAGWQDFAWPVPCVSSVPKVACVVFARNPDVVRA